MRHVLIDFNEIYSLLFFSNSLKLKKDRIRVYLKDKLDIYFKEKFNVKVYNTDSYSLLLNQTVNDYIENEFKIDSEEDLNYLLQYLDLSVVAEYADLKIWEKAIK